MFQASNNAISIKFHKLTKGVSQALTFKNFKNKEPAKFNTILNFENHIDVIAQQRFYNLIFDILSFNSFAAYETMKLIPEKEARFKIKMLKCFDFCLFFQFEFFFSRFNIQNYFFFLLKMLARH